MSLYPLPQSVTARLLFVSCFCTAFVVMLPTQIALIHTTNTTFKVENIVLGKILHLLFVVQLPCRILEQRNVDFTNVNLNVIDLMPTTKLQTKCPVLNSTTTT